MPHICVLWAFACALSVDSPESFWIDPGSSGSIFTKWLGHLRAKSLALLVERLDPSVAPLAARAIAWSARGS